MKEQQPGTPPESPFALSLTRVAVAQICQSAGFTTAQNSALNALTDIAARYLQAIAKAAAESANSSGRSQSNAFDIVVALEHLGSVQGFRGCSGIRTQCMLSSSLIVELKRFMEYADEIPFAKPLPRNFCNNNVSIGSRNGGGGVSFRHVPRWLPPMPELGEKRVREEEGKWEEGNNSNNGGCFLVGGEREGKLEGFELPQKRERVRIKIGGKGGASNNLRNGVCKSSAIGKRVLCHSDWSCSSSEEIGKRKKIVMSFSLKNRVK